MGPIIRRIASMLALAVVLIPAGAWADTVTTVGPTWGLGPQGGDDWNRHQRNAETGELAVVRVNPAGISGGLGCGGVGGFSNFAVQRTATTAFKRVTVSYTDALVDPYTFINVGVLQDDIYLKSTIVRGPLLLSGSVNVDLPSVTGTITVYFGLQVSSACPNIDGGRAIFNAVSFVEQ